MATGLEIDLSGFGLERTSYIGKGQFACCQLVREIATGQPFVAKCVKLGSLSDSYQALAHQEVFLLEALSHPFVVAYHDSFLLEHQDVLVILMEHCEGGDLRQLIAEKAAAGTQLSESQIMTWFAQLTLALQYVHGEKVLHRDLKCSNIFLVNGGYTLKLGDFGISRVLESTQEVAMTLVGTPYYLSPEVCSNEPYSWKSDVWSLGCVLYELCTLRHAFEHATLQGLVHRIKNGSYEPIPDHYSQELHDLIRQLLTTTVDLRPSIAEVIAQPFVQSYVAQQVLPFQPSIDVDSRNRSKDLRPSSAGLKRPGSSTMRAPEMPVLGPEDMSLVLASRIQSRLAEQNLSLLSTEHVSRDEKGVFVFLPGALRKTLQNLDLALSEGELTVFEASLPKAGGAVPVSSFEAKLAAAATSPKIQDLWTWARLVLKAPKSKISMLVQARDLKGLGMLSPSDFEAALREVAPHASSEHLARLMLLADKNEFGYIKYIQCIDRFGTGASLHEDSFFTCVSEDLRVIGRKHEAWDADPDPDEAWD